MEEQYQRRPTDNTTKQLVLDLLENITILYQKVLSALQIAVLENRKDGNIMKNFYEYTSSIIALYKMVKTKIPIVDPKKEKYHDLEFLDIYLTSIDEGKIVMDFDNTKTLFHIFGMCEEKLRMLCDELGYTSDKAVE